MTQKNSGFTLIELVVVTFIVALISTVSLANFRQGQKQKELAIASDTVINAIRAAQNYTLAGKKTNNTDPACRIPQYYLANFTYSSTFNIVAVNNCGSSDVMETYTLPTNTRIKANGLVRDGSVGSINLSYVFRPPFAALQASLDNSAYANFATSTITLEGISGTATKVITIDGVAGRIGE